MLAGSFRTYKKPKLNDANEHTRKVSIMKDDLILAIIEDLKHNKLPWAKARRVAALDEAERRSLLAN